MAEPNSVAWQFERKGVVTVPGDLGEDELMEVALDAGAEDIVRIGDRWQVICDPSSLTDVRAAIDDAGIEGATSDLTMQPQSTIELATAREAKAVLAVLDALDDHDDVQEVYGNFDISDEILAELQ